MVHSERCHSSLESSLSAISSKTFFYASLLAYNQFFWIPVSATWMTGEGTGLTTVIPLLVSGIYAKRYRGGMT
ncbi:hypothetical protein [Wolbachia endosymbiont of Psylliodes chrysocephala]|uniref:hypothetical protein n=1 Tax=Wolbachia endosymbiont of Psylliodes chrysocephala TaxID=2883236 RepID=UPI0020A17D2E|nr:hypothetical protein [Wolbachia endosymbiont of Psylliodes chrysocephala]